MRDFGLKHSARALAEASGLPLLPGTGLLDDLEQARREAGRIGFPVMLKSTAGGGGIGMQLCRDEATLGAAFEGVQRLGRNNFANAGVFLERYVEPARHVEVQIFGDGRGRVLALGERDCSLQRRNQKVIEETPAPNLPAQVRTAMLETARRLGASVAYRSAGTVEYIYDPQTHDFYFLEVNTRLQVEHGVTEAVTGIDLVEWMVRLGANGELPELAEPAPTPRGHAIQARIYAEDPGKGFQPSAGLLTQVEWPQGLRCDTWVEPGSEVPPFYDPMLAKLVVQGTDRTQTLAALGVALDRTALAGIETNLAYLRQVAADPVFATARHHTRYLDGLAYKSTAVEVLAAGTQTTVQDWPGRLGYWDVGVPPSGPMDDLAFRLGNRLLGNDPAAAGLEITVTGPTLRFRSAAWVCLTGAPMGAELDGTPVPWWQPFPVPARGVLRIGQILGAGARGYLSVAGGISVPEYLGSRSTFTLGRFGGHAGRPLQVGDVLHLAESASQAPARAAALPPDLIPAYGAAWELRVIYGPHGAPDFFTPEDIETFFATDWEVHYNSSRTGVRLVGPKPEWARSDGGEAGLHPSNIHDNAYAVGTVDFTGDMPVILGPDGPSLGGFVCPATLVSADLWKLGQLCPGDRVRFVPVDQDAARALDAGPNPEHRAPGARPGTGRADPTRRPQGASGRPGRTPGGCGLSTLRGSLPLGGVRAPGPRHPPALQGPCPDAGHPGPTHPRGAGADPGHPLPAGPLRQPGVALGQPDRPPGGAGRRACGYRGAERPRPSRPLAPVLGRLLHPTGHRKVHAVGTPGRPLVSEQHRVYTPHQWAGEH